MTRNFEELRRAVRSNPERLARIEEFKRAMEDAVHLAHVREKRAASQGQVADRMAVSQGRISQIEHAQDWYLSTLSGYVAALGGRLHVTAQFDNESIEIAVPAQESYRE